MRLKKGAGMRISADHIFTGADSVEAGRLVIENGIIQEILAPGESDLHLENTLLSCGWVNSHVHLDLSLPRDGDRVPGSFEDWLGSVVQSRRALGEELKEIFLRRGSRNPSLREQLRSSILILRDTCSMPFSIQISKESSSVK